MKMTNGQSKMTKILPTIAAFSLLVTAACSNNGYSQDPLADQADAVREGVPPQFGQKPPVPKPIPAEALKIDASDFYSFREGVEGQVKLAGRVLLPVEGRDAVVNQDFILVIENLGDFPGATFDAQTGLFKWTPAPTMSGIDSLRNKTLEVTLNTVFTPIMSVTRSIPVFVSRAENDPQILSVDGLLSTDRIREGESREFTVKVKDVDATDVITNRPRLMVVSGHASSGVSVAGFVRVLPSTSANENPVRDTKDPNNWIFRLALDLQKAEITPGQTMVNFHLIAVNRYGRTSTPKAVSKTVYSSVRAPEISLSKDRMLSVTAGKATTVGFMVYDPADEHHISARIADCDKLPGTAKCRCEMSDGNSSFQQCSIEWEVPASISSAVVKFTVESINRSSISSDQLKVERTFVRSILIQNPASPIRETPIFRSVVNGGAK